jgi:hypothetical protein
VQNRKEIETARELVNIIVSGTPRFLGEKRGTFFLLKETKQHKLVSHLVIFQVGSANVQS